MMIIQKLRMLLCFTIFIIASRPPASPLLLCDLILQEIFALTLSKTSVCMIAIIQPCLKM